jgi:asparagine synthase (glutamine-hydrolysing)
LIVEGLIKYSQFKKDSVNPGLKKSYYKFRSLKALIKVNSSPIDEPYKSRIAVSILENSLVHESSVFSGDAEFSCVSDFRYHSNINKNRFALEIQYDQTTDHLILKRDVFSEIPLYYIHIPNHFVAFSNNITALSQFEDVRAFLEPDKNKIATYLSFSQLSKPYDTASFFSEIKNVLPGHEVRIDKKISAISAISKFEISNFHSLSSKEDYGRAFKQVFRNSVAKIIHRKNGALAAHLSGGLDSSFISGMIKHVTPNATLHTFYSDTNTSLTNERHYAEEVAKAIDSIHHTIPAPYHEIDKLILHTELLGSPVSKMHSPARDHAIMQAVKDSGCGTLLTGEGGDSIAGYGNQYLGQLFNHKNWPLLKTELQKSANRSTHPFIHANWEMLTQSQKEYYYIRSSIYRLLAFKFRKLSSIEFFYLFKEVVSEFHIPPHYFLKRGTVAFFEKIFKGKLNIRKHQHDSYTQSVQSDLLRNLRENLPLHLHSSLSPVFRSMATNIIEEQYAISAYFGIETRFPFYDKELFELSLATPIAIKYDNGMRRGHVREAMKGIVPENVRLRQGKASFDLFARQSALRLYDQSRDFLTETSAVWEYVNKKHFNVCVQNLKQENQKLSVYTNTFFSVNRTIFLAVWLDWLKRSTSKNTTP